MDRSQVVFFDRAVSFCLLFLGSKFSFVGLVYF